jgi:protein O-GlcNAcase/histone acetyltransferase
MQDWGLNTYLYAPKDDLKHRARWRELYNDSEAAELKALIVEGQSKGIRFIYAIAPGLDAEFDTPAGLLALQEKARQLIGLGCAHFALLFDDIATMPARGPLELLPSVVDGQTRVAHELLKYLAEKTSAPSLLFCPTQYCGRMAGVVRESAYLRRLGETLEPAIGVLWTGPEIVSESISVESIRELTSVIGRKLVIWDNLHANDYDMRRLYMGPYSGRPLELRQEVAGVLSNPNCEFEVNFVPLRTLALWNSAQESWKPREAYVRALQEWLPSWQLQTPAVSPSLNLEPETGILTSLVASMSAIGPRQLEWLADCFYLPFESGLHAQELFADLQYLLHTAPSNWGTTHTRFQNAWAVLNAVSAKITDLQNRDLLYSLYRHVWELKEEIDLIARYVAWLESKPGFGEAFTSAGHRPKTYRGGFVAELQRLLPMDEAGGFSHRPSIIPKHDPDPYR